MTSSTKPEVHNVSQRCQDRVTAIGNITCTKVWWRSAVWFWSYASRQTETHKRNFW